LTQRRVIAPCPPSLERLPKRCYLPKSHRTLPIPCDEGALVAREEIQMDDALWEIQSSQLVAGWHFQKFDLAGWTTGHKRLTVT